MLDYVQANLSKTPAGWEEVLFDAGAATPETVVYAWANYNPYDITVTGRKVRRVLLKRSALLESALLMHALVTIPTGGQLGRLALVLHEPGAFGEDPGPGCSEVPPQASDLHLLQRLWQGPAGWSTCWYDPGTGLNSTLLPLLLGGEVRSRYRSVSTYHN